MSGGCRGELVLCAGPAVRGVPPWHSRCGLPGNQYNPPPIKPSVIGSNSAAAEGGGA